MYKTIKELPMSKEKTNEGLFGAAKKFSDAFFDGLKSNAINRALKQAEKNKKVPPPIIQKMRQIDKLAKELEDDLKHYS
jgi:hypothetical protein